MCIGISRGDCLSAEVMSRSFGCESSSQTPSQVGIASVLVLATAVRHFEQPRGLSVVPKLNPETGFVSHFGLLGRAMLGNYERDGLHLCIRIAHRFRMTCDDQARDVQKPVKRGSLDVASRNRYQRDPVDGRNLECTPGTHRRHFSGWTNCISSRWIGQSRDSVRHADSAGLRGAYLHHGHDCPDRYDRLAG